MHIDYVVIPIFIDAHRFMFCVPYMQMHISLCCNLNVQRWTWDDLVIPIFAMHIGLCCVSHICRCPEVYDVIPIVTDAQKLMLWVLHSQLYISLACNSPIYICTVMCVACVITGAYWIMFWVTYSQMHIVLWHEFHIPDAYRFTDAHRFMF